MEMALFCHYEERGAISHEQRGSLTSSLCAAGQTGRGHLGNAALTSPAEASTTEAMTSISSTVKLYKRKTHISETCLEVFVLSGSD